MMKLWFWLLSWFPGSHPCSDPDCGPDEDDHGEGDLTWVPDRAE